MSEIVLKNKFLLPTLKLQDQKYEFIFVLDRSGSMGGPSIEMARAACVIFLRSLPKDCYFNVIGFGTNFKPLFPHSVQYNQENLNTAVTYAEGMQADMGQNEVDLPLKFVYEQGGIRGYLTQIFVLTDGCQEFKTPRIDIIINLINRYKTRARVYSLGIGNQASEELVNRMATAGGGVPYFVLGQDTIQTKVLQQLQISLKPSLLKPIRIST